MKKTTKITIALLLIALMLLTACGQTDDNTADTTKPDSTQSEQADNTSETDNNNDDAQNNDDNAASGDNLIAETVLFDQNGVKVSATAIEDDPMLGTTLQLMIENSTDQELELLYPYVAVNGYMVRQDLMFITAPSNDNEDGEIFILPETLKNAGVTEIGDIEMMFEVRDSEGMETIFKTDKIMLKTKLYDSVEHKKLDDGVEIYNQDGFRIVAKYAEKMLSVNQIVFFMENNSGHEIVLFSDNLTVNGVNAQAMYTGSIPDGKMMIDGIMIFENHLTTADISEIKDGSIEFEMRDDVNSDDVTKTGELSFSF